MTEAVAALCTRHRYPDALRSVLERVVEACLDVDPQLVSLVLGGSAATGDYVYASGGGGGGSGSGSGSEGEGADTRLYSDLDLMLFSRAHASRPQRLDDVLTRIRAEHPSPLFEIDIAWNPASALDDIAPRYQMAEVRRAGVVLAGEDVLERFPERFDPRAAVGSFLNNLWKPLLHWTPRGSGLDTEYQQMAARLFLDAPLLANAQSDECVPGHRARAAKFLAEDERQGLHQQAIRERVAWAIEKRSAPSDERAGLERSVAAFARTVIAGLDGNPAPKGQGEPELVPRLARLLPPRSLRRIGGELRAIVRDPRQPLLDLAWWRHRKEASAGAALLGLLTHLGEIDGEGEAFDPPAAVLATLARFARTSRIERGAGESGLEFLFRCKRIFRDAWFALYPSSAKQDEAQAVFLQPPG